MISPSLSLIKITIVTSFLVTGTEQHRKWHKPYTLDGPPKYLYSPVYKPKSSPLKPLYSPSYGKPYSPSYEKPYLSSYEKPYAPSYEKPYSSSYEKPYSPAHEKPYSPPHEKPYSPPHEKPYSPAHEKSYLPAHEKQYSPGHEKPLKQDHCELRKVIFTQDAESPQYLIYKSKMPDLKEFTLCYWHNIFNYTHDHPIFSYTLPGKSRVIYSWIENSPQKTYYSLAINGHTIYRINYPEKLFKWYHVCQSWNGHTGEWQLWINSERVGRGFYNLMVGKKIQGGGVAISGREYLEQALAIHHSAYSGELTLVTLYKAALTAGKAYNDHKHHHVHNFHHGYDESVDEAETEEPPALPVGPMPTRPPHLAHGGPFANGQLVPKLPVETSVAAAAAAAAAESKDPSFSRDEQFLFDGGLYDFYAPFRNIEADTGAGTGASAGVDDTSFRVNLLDRYDGGRRNKRNATAANSNDRSKRWTPVQIPAELTDGLHGRKLEPAEWEVRKVASVCAACEPDPFGTAAVLSWHNTRKQFFNGALYLPALPKCFLF